MVSTDTMPIRTISVGADCGAVGGAVCSVSMMSSIWFTAGGCGAVAFVVAVVLVDDVVAATVADVAAKVVALATVAVVAAKVVAAAD